MRGRALLVLLTCLFLCAGGRPGAAQDLRPVQPVPEFPACRSTAHPQLPPQWRATYLMAPFTTGQLVVAEIVHDASLAATRITLYGVKGGTADFLVTGDTTHELTSEGETVTECRALGDTGWRPLPQDWLGPGSQCAGSAPILDTPVDWWKTLIDPAPSTYWVWYKNSDHTPFRLVFEKPSDRLEPMSRFALSVQMGFAPEDSELPKLSALCKQAASSPAGDGAAAIAERIDAMNRSPERADAALERLMPALKPNCPAPADLRWPERLAITGLLTPFDAAEDPVPTEVLYDWTVPGQRTRIFPPPQTGLTAQDALLLEEGGFTVAHRRNSPPSCTPGLPGTIRPNWPSRAPCTCEAQIETGTALTPNEPTQILSCPLALPRIAWASYGLSGRPSMFMVTSVPEDAGKGDFAVLDYFRWTPHRQVPRSVFQKAPQCTAPPPTGAKASAPSHCSTCHFAKSAN
jgi:hypothetical protein